MSISASFGTQLVLPKPTQSRSSPPPQLPTSAAVAPPALTIECSSRPQKKATAHHMKTRPKKSHCWDIKRGPAVYEPLPPLPPDWTLAEAAEARSPLQTTTIES